MINERPKLNMKLASAVFRNFYYLKQELIDFGRENRLPTLGSKIELADRIAHFLGHGKESIQMHSNLEQETMVRIRHSAIWSLLYISLYGVLTIASCFLLSEQTLATIGIVGGIFVLINIFLLPFKRELLFVGGIISVLGVMYGGVWIGKQLDLEGVLSIGAALSALPKSEKEQ